MKKLNIIKKKIYFRIYKRNENKNIIRIIKNSIYVKQNISNEIVIGYIKFINEIDIPDRILCKNIIIETYKKIKESSVIKDNIKSDLRMLLEFKGVSFIC